MLHTFRFTSSDLCYTIKSMNDKKHKHIDPEKMDRPFHEISMSRIEMQSAITERVDRISKEFNKAFEFIKNYPRSVTFFGSARFRHASDHYEDAVRLAERISKELQYTVLTGGGGGIMEAANKGAFNAGGESVGLNIKLPTEQQENEYVTDIMEFYYFFTRKVALSFAAEAYVFFPGGFGTLDEFFEIVTLIQTRKIPQVPVILHGEDFWKPLNEFIRENMFEKHGAISQEDMLLYHITEDEDEIIDIIRSAPIRQTG
ncbi:MAG: TIGR00730 family Rossman fold protein [Parcubacteria group bacterium CG11_big_fil_rev_8_21_14_0_20_39_22]|nr:MAG: TIGR00730 family Rossman fold protein [Parcubacteria group bacterium CG11_big_fil_rev_8_21_14_0_20_39_22]